MFGGVLEKEGKKKNPAPIGTLHVGMDSLRHRGISGQDNEFFTNLFPTSHSNKRKLNTQKTYLPVSLVAQKS